MFSNQRTNVRYLHLVCPEATLILSRRYEGIPTNEESVMNLQSFPRLLPMSGSGKREYLPPCPLYVCMF